MKWNLYSKEGKFLEPLMFSNGKTQADVVDEVLNSIKKGNKVIFIHGVCGTGKSAIALNIAKELGKSSVVVPIKNLQEQYKKDYEHGKYLLKKNNDRLRLSVITGRQNHKCKFLEDKEIIIPKEKQEVNSKLSDIFEFSKEELEERKKQDFSADKYDLPCKIELKEKNFAKIKNYLRQNNKVNPNNFLTIRDVKRVSVATTCPYWSPVIPDKFELKGPHFEKSEKKSYIGLNNTKFVFYQRKEGCDFYKQFNSFVDSDVIVFNAMKYKLEMSMDRKPLTEVEIIDECDEFLDSFSNQKDLNLDRLQNSLGNVFSHADVVDKVTHEVNKIIKEIKKDRKIEAGIYSKAIIHIKDTPLFNLFKLFIDSREFFDEIDDESYLFEVEETVRLFEDFLNETYLIFNKKDNNLVVSIVTTNLAKRFKEMIDKNKVIVLMSGTLHSPNVLKNIFGLENYDKIDAEVDLPGSIKVKKTGLEKDCKYDNFSKGLCTREDYLKGLDKCVEISEKPTLVHVNAFSDLPTKEEKKEFDLKNLISREELRNIQKEDKKGKLVEKFKSGEVDVLFSTRCSRGIDFPGEQCKSIIFTKYPNPNTQDAFWKILKQTKPEHFWDFYKDKARRELWQKVYRGVRFKEDSVFVLSPDSRVLREFEMANRNL